MTFIWRQFHKRYLSHQLLKSAWKCHRKFLQAYLPKVTTTWPCHSSPPCLRASFSEDLASDQTASTGFFIPWVKRLASGVAASFASVLLYSCSLKIWSRVLWQVPLQVLFKGERLVTFRTLLRLFIVDFFVPSEVAGSPEDFSTAVALVANDDILKTGKMQAHFRK